MGQTRPSGRTWQVSIGTSLSHVTMKCLDQYGAANFFPIRYGIFPSFSQFQKSVSGLNLLSKLMDLTISGGSGPSSGADLRGASGAEPLPRAADSDKKPKNCTFVGRSNHELSNVR